MTDMEGWTTESLLEDPILNPRKRQASRSLSPVNSATTTSSKRSRASTGTATAAATSTAQAPSSASLALQLQQSLEERNAALNSLLQTTASHDRNHALQAHGDQLVDALCQIAHQALNWPPLGQTLPSPSQQPLFHAAKTWWQPPSQTTQHWARHVQQELRHASADTLHLVNVVLVIFRNLSFVAANARWLAYSDACLNLLVGCLYEYHDKTDNGQDNDSTTAATSTAVSSVTAAANSSTSTTNIHNAANNPTTPTANANLALHALHTLVNLIPYLNVTGQALLCDKLFLDAVRHSYMSHDSASSPPLSKWGWGGLWLAKRFDVKEDVLDVPSQFLLQMVQSHLIHVSAIFSALRHVLTSSTSPRAVLLMALDLLKECLDQVGGIVVDATIEASTSHEDDDNNPHNVTASTALNGQDHVLPTLQSILSHMPDTVLQRLVDFLWIPRLGPDALDYVNPVHNVVSRVSTLKLLMGYDATVDTDLRDRSLDVLVPLVGLSEHALSRRLGTSSDTTSSYAQKTRTRLYDAIFPILSTKVGRNDAPLLATQLLRQLSVCRDNHRGLLYLQERLLELASRDARVAQLALTHLYASDNFEETD